MSVERHTSCFDTLSNQDRVKDDELSARLYTERKPRKHNSEMNLLKNAFDLLPAGTVSSVLDAPCGVGRVSVWLAQQGYKVTGVDLGSAAVNLTRQVLDQQGLKARIDKQNIMTMEFPDRHFDCCVCFRLLHHFEQTDQKQLLIEELCRVSKDFVVISYFSPVSVTAMKRRIRRRITGKSLKQYPDTLNKLQQYFSVNGFELYARIPRSVILHSLQLAVFRRR